MLAAATKRARAVLLACAVLASGFAGGFVWGCGESLPTRIVPENPLVISDVLIGQGAGDFGIQVTVSAIIRNNFDETFDGPVDITGELHVWWPRRPDVEAHVPLRIQDRIRLAPGRTYRVEHTWLLTTDDGRNVLDLLTYSASDVRFGVAYARPETFVADLRMTVFAETGLLSTGPREFTLQGWRLVEETDL